MIQMPIGGKRLKVDVIVWIKRIIARVDPGCVHLFHSKRQTKRIQKILLDKNMHIEA